MGNLLKQASRTSLSLAIGTTVLMFNSAQVHSQDSDATLLEEIIVTARGYEESLQDVPLSITAFTAEAMERKSIAELDDVARFTPGFSYEDFSGGLASPTIRGQAQNNVTALETNVSTFFDGIYIPRAWAVDVGTSNISRIEVVKGPQSARYGRNAFAGAINYEPVKASLDQDEIAGDLEVTFGVDERQDVGLGVQVPLSDQFVVAASYNYSEFDGSWSNRHPFSDINVGDARSTTGNAGGWEKTGFSISAAAEVTDALSLELAFYNYDVENESRASQWYDHNVSTGVFNCGSASLLICGEMPGSGGTTNVDPRSYGVHSDTDIIRLGVDYQISDTLSLSYLYGNIEGNTDIGNGSEPEPSACGSIISIFVLPAFSPYPLCNFQTTPIGSIDYDSHELRLDFAGDSLRGGFGVFLSDGEDDFQFISYNIEPLLDPDNFTSLVNQTSPSGSFVTATPGPFNVTLRDNLTSTDVFSVFGELHWTSSDGATRAGIEARYSKTEIDLLDNRAAATFSEDFTDIAPRFSFERDLSENTMLFASIAKGTKAGGFNPGAIAVENQSFDEEVNWTYEIGTKQTLLDGRMTFNSAVYYSDWSDIQVNSADPDATDPLTTNIILNLGNADIYGVEFDLSYQANENLSLDATLSISDGTYGSGTIDQRYARPAVIGVAPCDDVVCNSNGDVSGNEIERAPNTQASFGIQWQGNNYYLRADLSYQDSFYASTVNIAELPDRTLLNLRGGVDVNDNLSISAWVENATDEKYVSNSFVVISRFNNQFGQYYGERLTAGVTAKYDF